jgi:hypothetical protein
VLEATFLIAQEIVPPSKPLSLMTAMDRGAPTSKAETFDPAEETFSLGPTMIGPRFDARRPP